LLTLRDYQRAAVDAVTPDEHRALLVSGCGTGKTLMAVHAVAKLLAGAPGTVLLTFPTLGLLEQTYQVWRGEAPMPFSALAVCSQQISDPEDIADDELSIPSTTSAEQLAHWLADTAGVRVVFATYQSAAVLVEAHRAFGAPAWTVMVCDEAHRTAGRRGKPFAVVLDDHKIPAAHRLFFTATPKVHARGSSPSRGSARPRRNAVASMDNPDLYGRRVFSLPTRDAIQRGILSPFKVAVIAVTDSAVASALKDVRLISLAAGEDGSARADHVAAAIALTQAADDYQLSSVLAFHNTIAASRDFAATFARTHALLRARGLVSDRREAHITHIDGGSPLRERKAAAEDTLGQHRPDQWNIVTNARCITEGIDIPALDAVFFAEPRSSDIDVAQAVGRAIRKNPHHDRPALIVLALTVDDSLDAETVIDLSQFKKARQVLLALQSHDPSIGADLTRLWDTLGETGPGDSDSVHTDLVDILIPTDLPSELAEQFLRAFSVHTVDTLTQQWEDNFAALAAYAAAHGHASPPQQYTTPDGRPLGQWVSGQRRAHSHSRMLPQRIERLERLPGWAWNVVDARWETNFAALAAYADTHGHSYPPRTANLHLNQWVIGLRRPGQRQRLREDQRKRLEDLPGWSWAHRQTRQWENYFEELAAYAAAHGHASPPSGYMTAAGVDLGEWVRALRRPSRRAKLAHARKRRLESLPGWSWEYRARPTWEAAFDAVAAYAAEHGHTNPPGGEQTDDGRSLASWVTAQRQARSKGKLSAERCRRLEALPGWSWNLAEARWEENFVALAAFAATHRSCDPPPDYVSSTGASIADWLRGVRRAARAGRLSTERLKRLQSLPGWSPETRRFDAAWDENYDQLVAYADEHGHAAPGQHYRTASGMALGHWVSNQRAAYRTGRMARDFPDRIGRLEALPGWAWNTFDAQWDRGFRELQAYCAEHEAATPGSKFVTPSGHRLGQWVSDQRKKRRAGQLSEERCRRLEALAGWSW